MFNNMLYAVKRRMIDEVEGAFHEHPAFTEKVRVYNKFPYEERVQYGVVLSNTSASQLRLSADNYLTDLYSHVRLARETNYPGLSIEWVRENPMDVTKYFTENVSAQLGPTQRMFRTSYQILSGNGNTAYATNVGQIVVQINGMDVLPEYVNGERGVVMLRSATAATDVVEVSYYCRKIVPPGIYVFDFPEDNQFYVAPIYIINKELVLENTTGTEITASLANQNVYPKSDYLFRLYRSSTVPIVMVRGVDYSIDYPTGVITFLQPLDKGYNLYADYRWQPTNYVNGPYTFEPYQENHEVLPGVVLAIGRRAKKGDRQVIIVSKFREDQAMVYGGHWTMSLDFKVIAKDPIQMEEMTDQVVSYLWGTRKNALENEGITFNSIEPSGESEETFIEGEMYYESNVDISVQTEWQAFVPYLYSIKEIIPDIRFWPGTKEYEVSKDLQVVTLKAVETDTRMVLKYPTAGYEKLT